MPFSADSAETLALKALSWLIGNDELLPVFLGSTGASEADVKTQMSNPEFLGSVLDFLMMDDAWIVAFCDANTIPYDHPMQARAVLAGPADMHWT
ncbi:DUF3572 domain-containing protein [Falsiruegeria mediterranea]|jgi:Protein of unknown function (DUF3572)|uniref:DUF3572 domain-containing protein n=1 Tax=Falsiruegeria mediterranea M17 TaxID=1200281 RepID=A0A2R8CFC0_9RHOB|nr:DUF3572 domain-containing protein [Falsiruegeria mediterranea]SPJ31110.1 hypothetical protein TRM7615_04650 [Falsiruegeria mediterranea M17]